MKNALIIFTRVPEPGKTKTRLQTLLTKEECARMHEAILGDQRPLCHAKEWDTFVFYTPEKGKEKIKKILPGALEYYPQEEIEFGERMKKCIKQVLEKGYESCLLVGTDIPSLDTKIISLAFSILIEKDMVIGATKDLGYYLIGMKRIYNSVFENQQYGTGSVYGDTVAKIVECGCTYGTLPVLRDIDEPDDLKEYWKEYSEKPEKIHCTWEYLAELNEKYGLEK